MDPNQQGLAPVLLLLVAIVLSSGGCVTDPVTAVEQAAASTPPAAVPIEQCNASQLEFRVNAFNACMENSSSANPSSGVSSCIAAARALVVCPYTEVPEVEPVTADDVLSVTEE